MTRPITAPAPTTAAGHRTALAMQRIDASRTKLILALAPSSPKRTKDIPAQGQAANVNSSWHQAPFSASLAAHVAQKGVGKGAWQALAGAATDWLGAQPWYTSVELVGSTLVHQAKPMVRRHPWICLGAAAAAGAALVALRPWGWQPVQHRMAPWRSQVGKLVWGQLTQTPVQMALAGALAAWLSSAGATPTPSPAPTQPGPPPPPPPAPAGADSAGPTPVPVMASAAQAQPASSPGVMPAASIKATNGVP